MSSRLLAVSDGFYQVLLQLYPRSFRMRFAVEMGQVFRALCREIYAKSGAGGVLRLWLPVLWDWAWSALYQWWLRISRRSGETMGTNLFDRRDGVPPLSTLQAGLAALPFLAFGISSMASRLEFFHTTPASMPYWQILLIHPYFVFNWLILIGLGTGILVGFPRWGYSFLGWALLFGWWWSNGSFYGHVSDWRIWLPLVGVFLIALLIRRSWQPLRALFSGIWREWTLLCLVIYIFYGFVYMLFDENHSRYLIFFIVTTTLAISLGAWGYFRSASPLRRILALGGGLFLAGLLGGISDATWDFRADYGLPAGSQNFSVAGVIFAVVLTLFMLGIGLLSLWRNSRNSKLKKI